MIRILPVIVIALIAGCSPDEHPSYEPIENNLKPGGPTINYDPQ